MIRDLQCDLHWLFQKGTNCEFDGSSMSETSWDRSNWRLGSCGMLNSSHLKRSTGRGSSTDCSAVSGLSVKGSFLKGFIFYSVLTFFFESGLYYRSKLAWMEVTCNVLSNQRLPLFQRAPPPCSICAATRLWYISSDTRGIGASKQTVKILFWMARTDSLFVLSDEGRKKTQ